MGTRLALLVCFAALVTAESASAAYPGSNGRIAFDRADGYIYSVNSDGTGLKRLGPGATPSYSPDGARIAFVVNGDIWTMNADGTNRRRVTTSSANETGPTWSPDGSRLAFTSDRTVDGIYAVRSTAPYGTAVLLESTPGDPSSGFGSIDAGPAWASNGMIYFTRFSHSGSQCDDTQDTWRVNPATHAAQKILVDAIDADPGPGAKALVYTTNHIDPAICDIDQGISIAGIAGGGPHAVTTAKTGLPLDGAPVFSPSGTLIAFQRGSYVHTIRPNGSGLRRVVAGQNPSWQPIP